jgi:hypothetical protein
MTMALRVGGPVLDESGRTARPPGKTVLIVR